MCLRDIKPESIYIVERGGMNFVVVDEIHIYKDSNRKSFVVQNNKFHKRLYSENVHEEILSKLGKSNLWEGSREKVLKSVCKKLSYISDYIVFHAAHCYSGDGKILTSKEILNNEIDFENFHDLDLPF